MATHGLFFFWERCWGDYYAHTHRSPVDNLHLTYLLHLLFLFCACTTTERRSLRRRRADAAVRVLPEAGAPSRRAAARRRQQERLLLERGGPAQARTHAQNREGQSRRTSHSTTHTRCRRHRTRGCARVYRVGVKSSAIVCFSLMI